MPSPRPTTCWPPWWTTTSTTGTRPRSTLEHSLEAGHRHERPVPEEHHPGARRQGLNGVSAGGRVRDHRRLRDHGHPVPLLTMQELKARIGDIIMGTTICANRSSPGTSGGRRHGRPAHSHQPEPCPVGGRGAGPRPWRALRQHRPWLQFLAATRMALKLADYTVTEAGFGADLGAEKFFHITCRTATSGRPPWCWWSPCGPMPCTASRTSASMWTPCPGSGYRPSFHQPLLQPTARMTSWT